MSKDNLNLLQTKKQLEIVQLKEPKIKVIMPLDFMSKVKYLCRAISEVEWSGVLFYEMEGSISNPESMVITLKDILLMDKGTAGLTEYDFDKDEDLAMDLVEKMMVSPQHKEWKRGLIHSHNKMNVFFSATDNEELIRSSEFYNFYLSLIVNNASDWTAKVAFRAKTESSSVMYIARNEKGELYTIPGNNLVKEFVFTYDTIIHDPIEVNNDFITRTNHIIDKAKIKDAERMKSATNNAKIGHIGFGNGLRQSATSPAFIDEIGDDFIEIGLIDEKYYDFAAFLIRLGNVNTGADGDDDVQDAIEDATLEQKTTTLPSAIMENFMDLHDKFFRKEKDRENSEFIFESLENVIGVFEEHEELYPWVTNIALTLKSFGNKLSHHLNSSK
jgi:hypothetical protein